MALDVKKVLPALKPLEAPKDMSKKEQLEIFYRMGLMREFDTKVRDLWMAGKIYGLAHSYVGAEAIGMGVCAALEDGDCISSTHRGHGHCIARGADVNTMMAELFGKYEGYNRGKGGSMHIADTEHGMLGATGIVGSGMPLALGAGMAFDRQGKGRVAVCLHGDGGTNQGVWHESMNMASAWKLPVIFVIENNQFAIATSIESITGEPDLYKRATGYGMPGVQVDGFNVFDVYNAMTKAIKRARAGEGPTLIEGRFLRLLGHFVADDQWYRDLKEVEPFWAYEPLKRMREYLVDSKTATAKEVAAVDQKAIDDVAEAIRYAEEDCTEPPLDTLYDDIYANGEVIL